MDNLFLTGPSGTTLNVGSWLRPYDKPDYGAKSLLSQSYSENPFSEGGVLAYEHLGVRHMALPVIMPSVAAYGGLAALESMFRLVARPGAVLDVQPQGMSDAIRFDVIGGRYEEDYDTYENTVMRRKGTIYLDTQPLGYLPTLINIASGGTYSLPGQIDLSGVSFIGDAPGLAELVVQPSAPTSFPVGTWLPDSIVWSLGGRASAQAWWPAGSMVVASSIAGGVPATVASYGFSPQSAKVARVFPSPTQSGFLPAFKILVPTSLEPAYRGRFRVFAFTHAQPSQSGAWAVSVDGVSTYNFGAPLASAAQVATISQASPALGMVDCGELTLPPGGSGLSQAIQIRFWTGYATGTAGIASPFIDIGGVFLQSLDGANGVLQGGLNQSLPFGAAVAPGKFVAQAYERRAIVAQPANDLSIHDPISDITGNYRGGFPIVAPASTSHLDLAVVAAGAATTSTYVESAPMQAAVSLSYRPRFFFLHGL